MRLLLFLIGLAIASPASLKGHPGVGIVENSKGEIFFTDLKQVWKITTSGELKLAVAAVHTHELFLDTDDNLFGEHLWYNGEAKNTWSHYVWKLSANGSLTKVIPDKEGFLENYSFVRDHHGRMYWADRSSECQKVARLNSDKTITRLGDQCFHNIRKVQALPDGTVFLVDFQDLKKIDPRGNVQTMATQIADKSWTSPSVDNLNAVMGIWSDKHNNIYTAISSAGVVKRFGLDGREETVFQSSLPWAPSGGLVDSQGRLWILEFDLRNAVRAQCVSSNSKVQTYKP
jgi:hypothetical protein